MRTFRIGFFNDVDRHDDETEFDVDDEPLGEMICDLFSLWYDFCHENGIKRTRIDYVEEVAV